MKKVTVIILCLGMFLVGLLTSQVFQVEKANAGKMLQYKVVKETGFSSEEFEKILNTYANQGWKLHSTESMGSGEYRYIFER